MKKNGKSEAEILRQQAEELMNKKNIILSTQQPTNRPEPEMLKLIHELEVHQVELELQNVELRRTRLIANEAVNKYTELYDFAPTGYFSLSEESNMLELNLTGAAMLGKDRSKLINKLFSLYVTPETRPVFNLFLEKAFQNTSKQTCEIKLIKDGGMPIDVLLTGLLAENDEQCKVTVVDITESKQTKVALRESNEVNALTMQTIPFGMHIVDESGTILFVSDAMQQLFDEPLPGKKCWEIYRDDKKQCSNCPLHGGVQIGETKVVESQGVLGGKSFEIYHTGIMYKGKKAMLEAFVDITERKQIEEIQKFLLNCGYTVPGENFFQELAKYLSNLLNMEYVCIDKLEGDKLTAQTVAIYNDGNFDTNVSYTLNETPCGEVVGKNICCYHQNVSNLFPNDVALQELKAESYVGTTLWGFDGKPIGLIAIIGRKPMANPAFAETVLKLVAVRAAGEMERLQAEVEQKESKERLKIILDTLTEGVALNEIIYNEAGEMVDYKIISVNDAFYNVSNINKDIDVIGMTASQLYGMSSETINTFWKTHKDIAVTQFTELKSPLEDKWFYISTSPIRDNRFVTSFNDITERRQTEEKLRKNEAIKNKMVSNIGDVIVIIDQNEINRYKSPNVTTLFGWQPEELVGKSTWDVVHADDMETARKLIASLATEPNATGTTEIRYKRKDGNYVWIRITLVNLLEDPDIQGFLGNYHDITERKQTELVLYESREEYHKLSLLKKAILESPQGIIVFALDTNYCYLDFTLLHKQTMKTIWGAEIEKGSNMLSFISNEIDREKAKANFDKVLGGEQFILVEEYGDENLTRAYYEDRYSPIFDENNTIIGLAVFVIDITGRTQTELVLQESEEKFRSITEQTTDLVSISDSMGIITYASSASETLFQYSPEEMCGRNFIEFVDEAEIPRALAVFRDTLESDTVNRNHEFKMKRKDGSLFIGEIYGKKFQQGLTTRTLVVIRDITERKQAEEKIREKDIQFRKLSANLPDLIFQFTRKPDGTYCVPIASAGIKNIFGCSPEDVIDDFAPIGNVIFPDDAERVINEIEYSAEHLTYFTCEFRVQIPGKPIQWIFSRSSPEKLPDGSITWYGFNADITERKQVELELITAKEQAEESDRLKSAFLANMSHEIRTPMNGILGFASLLKQPDLSGDEQHEFIGIIEKSGVRMLNIINDIVDISKIEAGLMKLNIQESNINEQVEYIYTFFKPEVEAKGMKLFFNTTLPAKEAIISTDREKLFAILTNLVKNAIKYSEKGTIEFGYELVQTRHALSQTEIGVQTRHALSPFATTDTRHALSLLQFYVKDTGIGIPKDRQTAIFERFIQADNSDTRAFQGAGLGLSISKAYLEMLGGEIWVESEEGKGSTFYFTLPYTIETEEKNDSQAIGTATQPNTPVSGLKILIAEDDETSEKLIGIMVKMFGKEILKTHTGTDTVEVARNNPDIDLILMDIQMPMMGGYEATRLIRAFNKDVIIIAQTAYGLTGDREKAIDVGCNDYISKPIDRDDLLRLMKKHLKR